ncbi:16367_t:CDS:2, partial [Cetraspora pellucida]
NNIVSVIVDFNNSNSAFSNNLDLEEKIEFADEPEILDVKTKIKINQIKINTLQNYYSTHEPFLATILNSRNKKIEFATDSQKIKAKTYLIAKYELFKESASTLYDITQIKDNKKENALLAAIYISSIQNLEINKEIQQNSMQYLCIPATSTSNKHLFSKAENLITTKHNYLNSDLFKQ